MNTGQTQIFYSLDGLTLRETTTVKEGIHTFTCKDYPLVEVTPKELMEHRLSKNPGFVLKIHGKLYYTPFPRDVHLTGASIGLHLCGMCRNVCNHCEKVDDWTVQFHCRTGKKFPMAVIRSGRIEKYDFIPYAVETFNCEIDTYLILECANYVPF